MLCELIRDSCTYEPHMSPDLSSTVWRFEHGNAIELCNEIILDFHAGLSHVWQSCVEIEGYSIPYFDRIAAFEVLYHWTSVKGEARMRFIDLLDIHASMKHVWALLLMEVQRYSASNTAMWLQRNNLWFLRRTVTYFLWLFRNQTFVPHEMCMSPKLSTVAPWSNCIIFSCFFFCEKYVSGFLCVSLPS